MWTVKPLFFSIRKFEFFDQPRLHMLRRYRISGWKRKVFRIGIRNRIFSRWIFWFKNQPIMNNISGEWTRMRIANQLSMEKWNGTRKTFAAPQKRIIEYELKFKRNSTWWNTRTGYYSCKTKKKINLGSNTSILRKCNFKFFQNTKNSICCNRIMWR